MQKRKNKKKKKKREGEGGEREEKDAKANNNPQSGGQAKETPKSERKHFISLFGYYLFIGK